MVTTDGGVRNWLNFASKDILGGTKERFFKALLLSDHRQLPTRLSMSQDILVQQLPPLDDDNDDNNDSDDNEQDDSDDDEGAEEVRPDPVCLFSSSVVTLQGR